MRNSVKDDFRSLVFTQKLFLINVSVLCYWITRNIKTVKFSIQIIQFLKGNGAMSQEAAIFAIHFV